MLVTLRKISAKRLQSQCTGCNLRSVLLMLALLCLPAIQAQAQTSTISTVNASRLSGTTGGVHPLARLDLAIRRGNEYWNGTEFQPTWARVGATVSGNDWHYDIQPPLPAGFYYINTRAIDISGGIQSPLTSVEYDSERPTSIITSSGATVIKGPASDNDGNVSRVEIALRTAKPPYKYWSGGVFIGSYHREPTQLLTDNTWSYEISPQLPPATYVVSSVAFDDAGNHQLPFAVNVFTVTNTDDEQPKAVIATADPQGISGTATDNVAIDRIELAIRRGTSYWNGSSFGGYNRVRATLTGTGGAVSWDYQTELPQGTYYISALAFDTSGNVERPFVTRSFTIRSDLEAPLSNISTPSSVQSLSEIYGSATDNIALDRVELAIRSESSGGYWNGSFFQSTYTRVQAQLDVTGNWAYRFSTPLPVGSYGVGSIAFDAAANAQSPAATASITVTGYVASTSKGVWSSPISMPAIPVSAANLPNGKILTWAAYNQVAYSYEQDNARTYTSIFDPATNTSQLSLVTEMQHDMFCPGANILADGRVLINGGSSAAKTSIYDAGAGVWSAAQTMNIPRAYQANTMLSNGSVLTLGGSWKDLYNDMAGNKTAEIWNPSNGWRVLNGIPADSMQTNDRDGAYRSDNHMWLFSVAGGKVLHAGPSKRMHLLNVNGSGSYSVVGNRADDNDAMNGNAVMYDVGKILTLGGAPHYENSTATASAFIIATDGNSVSSRRVDSMGYKRVFQNSVVLPNGEVVVIGGQAAPIVFSDQASVMVPELWNPVTEKFRPLAPMAVPRNYHSIAILLADGRILAGGGGLCGNCNANHADVEIFTPPYLVDSNGNPLPRPVIQSTPSATTYGQTITVNTDNAISQLVLMRSSVVTHSVNNDQRRVPLSFASIGENAYRANIPSDSGVLIPGDYMLFALDQNGTPSQSRLINIQ